VDVVTSEQLWTPSQLDTVSVHETKSPEGSALQDFERTPGQPEQGVVMTEKQAGASCGGGGIAALGGGEAIAQRRMRAERRRQFRMVLSPSRCRKP
jgi:hypothetical protein